MFRKILIAAATTTALTVALAAPTHAAGPRMVQNGVEMNGLALNGFVLNGFVLNGFSLNGLHQNGLKRNGLKQNGLKRNGVEQTAPAGMTLQAIELPPASH